MHLEELGLGPYRKLGVPRASWDGLRAQQCKLGEHLATFRERLEIHDGDDGRRPKCWESLVSGLSEVQSENVIAVACCHNMAQPDSRHQRSQKAAILLGIFYHRGPQFPPDNVMI